MNVAPASLRDRLAFHLDVNDVSVRDTDEIFIDATAIEIGTGAATA